MYLPGSQSLGFESWLVQKSSTTDRRKKTLAVNRNKDKIIASPSMKKARGSPSSHLNSSTQIKQDFQYSCPKEASIPAPAYADFEFQILQNDDERDSACTHLSLH